MVWSILQAVLSLWPGRVVRVLLVLRVHARVEDLPNNLDWKESIWILNCKHIHGPLVTNGCASGVTWPRSTCAWEGVYEIYRFIYDIMHVKMMNFVSIPKLHERHRFFTNEFDLECKSVYRTCTRSKLSHLECHGLVQEKELENRRAT